MAMRVFEAGEEDNKKPCYLIAGSYAAGKTSLIKTLNPATTFVVDTEAGLMPLRGLGYMATSVRTIEELGEVVNFLNSSEGAVFETVVLDSITELGEAILAEEKKRNRDPRKAYGELHDKINNLMRVFRDIPNKRFIATCKLDRVKDEITGEVNFFASMPSNKLSNSVPSFFDVVLVLRTKAEDDGTLSRFIQANSCKQYVAKDRSQRLQQFNPADLSAILTTVEG